MSAYSKCIHAVKTLFTMLRGKRTVEENGKLFLNMLPETYVMEKFFCMPLGSGNGVLGLRLKLFRDHSASP